MAGVSGRPTDPGRIGRVPGDCPSFVEMSLKRAILWQFTRRQAQGVCDDLDIDGVDRRSLADMRRGLGRSRNATPEVLLDELFEDQLKNVCEELGLPATGRRGKLVERLLEQADGPRATAARRAAKTGHRDKVTKKMGKRRAAIRTERLPLAEGSGAEGYRHPEATSPLRPDVGTQSQFRKRKPPTKYRYDSSLSPALDWDGQNPAREQGEAALAELLAAGQELAAVEDALAADPPPSGAELKSLRQRLGQLRAAVESAANKVRALGDTAGALISSMIAVRSGRGLGSSAGMGVGEPFLATAA